MTKIVKVTNFPKHTKPNVVKAFFSDFKVKFIRMENCGYGLVTFKNEEDAVQATKKNMTVYKSKKITVKLFTDVAVKPEVKAKPKFSVKNEDDLIEEIMDTGRLYLRNLYYGVTETEIVDLFKAHGDLIEVTVPFDFINKRPKGFAYVTFMSPEDAVKAYKALNRTKIGDRKVHILPSAEKPDTVNKTNNVTASDDEDGSKTKFQEERMEKLKSSASNAHNWNAMFVNSDAVSQYLADQLKISKGELFNDSLKGSIAVKLSMAEAQLVLIVQQFLEDNNINVEELKALTSRGPKSKASNIAVTFALSSTTFIVKNLTPGVTKDDLFKIFHKFDGLDDILLPPYGLTAIVSYKMSQQAKAAYVQCAYMLMGDNVLMLQWAPLNIFKVKEQPHEDEADKGLENVKNKKRKHGEEKNADSALTESDSKKTKIAEEAQLDPVEKRSTKLIVKNLSFQATRKELQELFGHFKGFSTVRMSKKDDGGHRGFAFLEFETEDDAQRVKESMGISTHLLGRRLVLEYSEAV